MSAVDIDRLQIEVEVSSTDAAKKLDELSDALQRLKRLLGSGSSGLGGIGNQIRGIGDSASKASKSFGLLKQVLQGAGLRKAATSLGSAVASMNDYVETVNLFQVSMGGYYDKALEYAELVNEKLGVDPAQWMRTQGVFMSMGKGFGMAEQQAYDLSEGLTELAYDISSLYNEDIESAATRLQSALAGEIEPIRRLGISISQATLQEYAMAKGINESVASMTEQEKALLRSLKLIEDAGKIGAIGDFAKTLESPANAVRVLTQQFTQLKRAIGSVFLPIVIQAIPYVQAFTSILTDMIASLAALVGFTMPEWDNSAWSDSFDGAAGSVEDTTKAVKKLKNATIGLDELNIISPNSGGAGAGGLSDWAADLEIPELWNKQQIEEINTKARELREVMEPILEIVLAIGAAFLAWQIGAALFGALTTLSTLLAGAATAVHLLKDAFLLLSGHAIAATAGAVALANALKFAGVAGVITIIITRLVDLWNKSEKFRTGVERIGDVIGGVFTVVGAILERIGTMVGDIAMGFVNMFPEPVKQVFIEAIEYFRTLIGYFELDVGDLLVTLAGIGLLFVPGGQILGIVLLAFEAITVAIRGLGNISDETWESMKNAAKTAFENVKKSFSEEWEAIKTFMNEQILPLFSLETWMEIGKQVVDGLFKGLGALAEGAGKMVKELLELVCDILGINSPSKEFEAIGEYSVAGMEKGFEGLYVISDTFGDQLGVMQSYATGFSDVVFVLIDTGLSAYMDALLAAKEYTKEVTNAMTTMFRTMASNSNAAIRSIISNLNSIPRNITTVHTIITKSSGSSGSTSSGVKAFASGGFPDHGQMFIARESGPELVGTIGSRTAVANNGQIEAGIEEAAYRGFIRAISESGGSGSPVVVENRVFLDGKQMRASFKKAERESGALISTGGVLSR